jgi:hypothetical protein
MGERRVAGLVAQTTLVEPPAASPPPPPPPPAVNPVPTASGDPTPVVYAPVAASGIALRERQLRWMKERDRRRNATTEAFPPTDP